MTGPLYVCKRCGRKAVTAAFLGYCLSCFHKITREEPNHAERPGT